VFRAELRSSAFSIMIRLSTVLVGLPRAVGANNLDHDAQLERNHDVTKSALLAAAFAVAAATTGATMAEAKKGHGHHHGRHHHHRHFGFYAAPIYVAPAYESCGYAYHRWMATGSFHWKKRYYACKGWY
jgi:hypothetical protein